MNTSTIPHLYSVADEPLALFVSPGRLDHLVLSQRLSERPLGITGVVFDPCCEQTHGALKDAVRKKALWCVLDTKSLEIATPGGFNNHRAALPWAAKKQHAITDFEDKRLDELCGRIAQYVVKNNYTAVFAPTHYLASGISDPWFLVDKAATRRLRDSLDSLGKHAIPILYPLAMPMTAFRNTGHVASFVSQLRDLPIAALWLRISPFGSDSGHVSLENFINACRVLQNAGLPIIAEKTGAIGLALLAFGAVSGLDTGVATGEKFDFQRLRRSIRSKKFGTQARIYVERLNCYLSRQQAKEFFAVRGMKEFACHDSECCLRGLEDMLADNKRHFLNARAKEVALLSHAPVGMRPAQYLDEILRPATDQLARVQRNSAIPKSIEPKIERENRKLTGWRSTLGSMKQAHVAMSDAKPFPRYINAVSDIIGINTPGIPEAI